jgi:hypothetical protein
MSKNVADDFASRHFLRSPTGGMARFQAKHNADHHDNQSGNAGGRRKIPRGISTAQPTVIPSLNNQP